MLSVADGSAKPAQLQTGKQHNIAKLQTLNFQEPSTVMNSSRSVKKAASSKTPSAHAKFQSKSYANSTFADESENEPLPKASNQTKTSLLLNSHRQLMENENKVKKALKDIQRKSDYLKGSSSSNNRVKPFSNYYQQHQKSNESLDSLKHHKQLCIDVKRVFNDELDSFKADESNRSINLSLSKGNMTNNSTDLKFDEQQRLVPVILLSKSRKLLNKNGKLDDEKRSKNKLKLIKSLQHLAELKTIENDNDNINNLLSSQHFDYYSIDNLTNNEAPKETVGSEEAVSMFDLDQQQQENNAASFYEVSIDNFQDYILRNKLKATSKVCD